MSHSTEVLDLHDVHPIRRAVLAAGKGVSYLVYAYVAVVQAILALGFALLLLGANPGSSFVDWVYRSLDRAMEPFRGIFNPIELGGADVSSVFETSVLFAMLVYAVLALVVTAVIDSLAARQRRLDRDNREYQRLVVLEHAARVR